ncbi:CLUMA_CG004121, isoform A [Clunio marinus]|uniref:CLUMA_CG004121, isoform A n=1 Tax=Clunio marinus TaxID=568069 RepID=A0A1J1HR57_9DIPT|nr:CLUMA_CG004121, isoform A [Clunio marinus]
MDEKKNYLSPAGYNLHGSTISLNLPTNHSYTVAGYKGSNEFILTDDNPKTTKEQLKEIPKLLKAKAKNICRKKILYKRVPILNWLPKYSTEDAIGDLLAGLTVGLTVIPQALAYSGIAQVPAAYGLYGSFLGCFVYIFLGSCKDVPMGPSAIAALLTFQAAQGSWEKACLLCFLTGLIELLMGIFNLGFLIDFVSGPVSSGFTSAVALIILSSQVKDIFGILAHGETFFDMWASIFRNIKTLRIGDTTLGLFCIVILLLMRVRLTLNVFSLLPNIKIGPKNEELKTGFHKFVNKTLWLIGTARNALIVIAGGALSAYFYQSDRKDVFKIIGQVPEGLPNFRLPPFSIPDTLNETGFPIEGTGQSFNSIVSDFGSALIVVPLIGLLENIAICKAFANGKAVDATQELIAIGVANIANSFVQGFPGNGALSRGAVNNASGVRTPMGSLYTGLLVILSLMFFTPYFFYIPKAALAGIIISAVLFMVEVRVVKPMWHSKKTDLIPGLAAFIACLMLPLELGILVGIGFNVIFILYHSSRPKIYMEKMITPSKGIKYLLLTPDRCLIFPSVDYVRNLINKQGLKAQAPVAIDCTHIYGADFTAAKVVETLLKDFNMRKQPLLFFNLKPSVCAVFEGVSLDYKLYYEFEALEKAIEEFNFNFASSTSSLTPTINTIATAESA